jgi:hypothetical protein
MGFQQAFALGVKHCLLSERHVIAELFGIVHLYRKLSSLNEYIVDIS